MLLKIAIENFLTRLASDDAAPGGGATAALNGAQGASLIAMACRLTIGRPKYVEVEEAMQQALQQAEALRLQLSSLIDADVNAFDKVMEAYRLPKTSDEEKQVRQAAIQEGLKHATNVPVQTMAACVDVLRLCPHVLAHCNPNVVSDGGAGVVSAHGGMMIAALNVRINLNAIRDPEFVQQAESQMNGLMAEGDRLARAQAWTIVARGLGL